MHTDDHDDARQPDELLAPAAVLDEPDAADLLAEMRDEQRQAVELLVSGLNVTKTAEALDVSSQTIRRWKKEPEFRSALHRARREAWERVQDGLSSGAGDAIHKLRTLLEQDGMTDRDRIQAAAELLRGAVKATSGGGGPGVAVQVNVGGGGGVAGATDDPEQRARDQLRRRLRMQPELHDAWLAAGEIERSLFRRFEQETGVSPHTRDVAALQEAVSRFEAAEDRRRREMPEQPETLEEARVPRLCGVCRDASAKRLEQAGADLAEIHAARIGRPLVPLG